MVLLGSFMTGWIFWPVSVPPLVVSRETTFLTGPLNADGTVNYLAALNSLASEGITSETNAAIPILQALGPEMIDVKVRAAVLRQLGVEPLPAQAEYFVCLKDFVRANRQDLVPQLAVVTNRILKSQGIGLSLLDRALADEWLAANQHPLDALVRATQRPRFFVSLIDSNNPPTIVSSRGAMVLLCDDAGVALALQAGLRVADGDLDGAWQNARALHRFGGLYTQQVTTVGCMVGVHLDDLASQIDIRIAHHPGLSANRARAILRELQSMPDLPSMHRVIDLGQRCELLDCAMLIMRSPAHIPIGAQLPMDLPVGICRTRDIDFNVVLRRVNTYVDKMVAPMRVAEYAQQMRLLEGSDPKKMAKSNFARWTGIGCTLRYLALSPRMRLECRSNMVGDRLFDFAMPSLGDVDAKRLATAMRRRQAETALALAAWRSERGGYPAGLGELVPEYMPQVPVDAFSGKPLVYRASEDGYLLYSVGINGRDDGGGSAKMADADDIVVRVQ
jgi:hypothetical protein